MSKKTYYMKILFSLLNSSLISCWILVMEWDANREYFILAYVSSYFTLLFLNITCCLPMILLTDLLSKDYGNLVVWSLKFLNYHLPVIVASPLFIFANEGYSLIFEIPIVVLLLSEVIIKHQKSLTKTVFVTCALYLIHIIIFFIGVILMFSSTPMQ